MPQHHLAVQPPKLPLSRSVSTLDQVWLSECRERREAGLEGGGGEGGGHLEGKEGEGVARLSLSGERDEVRHLG